MVTETRGNCFEHLLLEKKGLKNQSRVLLTVSTEKYDTFWPSDEIALSRYLTNKKFKIHEK